MGRAPCCDKANVKRGPWSPEEDTKLKEYIDKYGTGGNWIALPHKAGLKRCGKSCRLRWLNYLRPNIKHGQFSDDEDRIICNLFASIGSRWSIIAAQLPGRTDNDIKNYWNTKLKKRFMGLFPSSQIIKPPPPIFSSQSSSINYYPTSEFSLPCLEPLSSIPSNLLNSINTTSNSTITSLLQSQENLAGLMHHYQEKDNSTLLMFGGEASCSSSDGSCNQNNYNKDIDVSGPNGAQIGSESYFYNGYEENQKIMIGNNGWIEKPNGLWGDTSVEYGLEEIKQLVSTNIGCSNFFNIDEAKPPQGRVMYF